MSLLAVLSKALCCWHAFKVWSASPKEPFSLDNNLDSFLQNLKVFGVALQSSRISVAVEVWVATAPAQIPPVQIKLHPIFQSLKSYAIQWITYINIKWPIPSWLCLLHQLKITSSIISIIRDTLSTIESSILKLTWVESRVTTDLEWRSILMILPVGLHF